ncbi:hypothetical protein JVU11DRAFT_2446 [Chiua virens]|nr:hypothetical protein JVU11DRAFT_2446 [Chiua virens]
MTKFVVWAPDVADSRRHAVQSRHFENIRRLIAEGTMRAGGGVLTEDSANAAPGGRKFGSCMIIEAESLEAARKIVESEVYYTEGVWDKEKLVILPIVLAHPLPPLSMDEVHLA